MNPRLQSLQPYPFEKLRALFAGAAPSPSLPHIGLGIGEPRHPAPDFIKHAMSESLAKLASYPPTAGGDALRQAIADWIARRYSLRTIDWRTEVLPVNGSREALFAFAQTVLDPARGDAVVVCPNPFYQIYEGAALLAGARPYYANGADYASVPDEIWRRTQLLYVWSYRNEGAFPEAVTNRICDDLVKLRSPRLLRLVARFFVRGGIFTSVVVEHRKPGWKPAAGFELAPPEEQRSMR